MPKKITIVDVSQQAATKLINQPIPPFSSSSFFQKSLSEAYIKYQIERFYGN